jgi:hypothetical protein
MVSTVPDDHWLFFLDADDMMHSDAFVNHQYCQDYEAAWGTILEYHNGLELRRFQISCIESYNDLISYQPYMSLQMGHFIKKSAWRPFNESMDVGEDWEYYLRIWKEHDDKCIKADRPFMVNVRGEHSTGPRSGTGQQWTETVLPMMQAALEEASPKIELAE